MKCIYCGENIKSWFFRAHQECYDKYIDQYNEFLKICVDYEKGNVEHSVAVKSLIKMTEQDNFYKKILLQDTETFNDIIRKNDIPIFFSKYFSVVEEKNSCRMKSVGWHETRPSWNVEKKTLSNIAELLITDKNLYIDLIGTKIIIPLNKIELVKEDYFNSIYFDVKTSSPYPHRYYLNFKNKKEKEESNLYYFLSCLSGK